MNDEKKQRRKAGQKKYIPEFPSFFLTTNLTDIGSTILDKSLTVLNVEHTKVCRGKSMSNQNRRLLQNNLWTDKKINPILNLNTLS